MIAIQMQAELFTTARFAKLNKQDWLEDYEREVAAGDYNTETVKITEIVEMSTEEYDEFANSLLTDREWLEGKGGSGSSAEGLPEVNSFWEFTPEQQEEYRKHSYTLCLAVQCKGRQTLYIDPQGYKYARYVGI